MFELYVVELVDFQDQLYFRVPKEKRIRKSSLINFKKQKSTYDKWEIFGITWSGLLENEKKTININ